MRTVLVVEDEVVIREVIKDELEEAGYAVVIGMAAIAIIFFFFFFFF